jgi:hypothetical protein
MSEKIQQFFANIPEINPPKNLAGLIIKKIDLEQNKLLKRNLLISRIGLIGSFGFLFYTSVIFGRAIAQSEFWYLASLLLTDVSLVAKNWQEFGYSLVETMPVLNIVAVLLPIFVLLLSANFYASLNSKKRHYKYV